MNQPRVEIHYCVGCKWLLRASWMATELLSTFEHQLGEVALMPSDIAGTYKIYVDGIQVWCRKRDDGFPEVKVLKALVRDQINPDQVLGHIDR